jgi:iron complex transport system ATP-binding protein
VVTIALDNVGVTLGGRAVLVGVSATFAPGRLIGVIGPNGAGKSTLARAMLGLLPTSGAITIDGAAVGGIARAALAKRIAYLPQGQMVHWPLSVERLVALGRLPHLGPLSRMTDADRAAIEHALADADMLHLRDRTATELSGGERARALMARALAVGAPALIADEPLAALDPGHQLQVMAMLRARADAGGLVIAVLHDLTMAARHCDRLLLLDRGRLVADGAAAEVLTPELLRNIYGIEAWRGDVADGPLIVPTGPAT